MLVAWRDRVSSWPNANVIGSVRAVIGSGTTPIIYDVEAQKDDSVEIDTVDLIPIDPAAMPIISVVTGSQLRGDLITNEEIFQLSTPADGKSRFSIVNGISSSFNDEG